MNSEQNDAMQATQPATEGMPAGQALFVQGDRAPLAARLFSPGPGNAQGLVVFFPGGGFIASELEEADLLLHLLAQRSGWAVLGASYTTASVCPFPAAVEDAHAVLRWATRNRRRLGWTGRLLVSAGIEAGGNLAAVAALMARDRGAPGLAGQMLLMPMLDPGLTSCSMRSVVDDRAAERAADACASGYRGYLPHAMDRTHPYANPLQSSRMKDLPPALILSADDDPLRDEAETYGARLGAAGVAVVAKRLPAVGLDQPHARCCCARKESALAAMTDFLAALAAPRRKDRA
ncbi:MAG TPA: alpha/beta hydrolase [Noviherbaspirillum sp.]|uniref:alpha/beta hydrolase n=1 Tax=Noviherbaspirillum sp. TaxID=1926288 RepID=UPI002F956952